MIEFVPTPAPVTPGIVDSSSAHCGAARPGGPLRCVSIDVEDYFHIEAAYRTIGRDRWDHLPARVERNTARLLDLFHRHDQRGTFFILGHVARRFPQLTRAIDAAGHEVASHGSGHDRLHRLDPQSFRTDLTTCRKLLEDQIGKPVIGYRAPTFSVTRQTAWAIDVLVESGFEYDASIFPVRHPWYGVAEAPLTPFFVRGRANGPEILEVPPLVWRTMGRNMATAGGGYFRLLPMKLMQQGLAQAAAQGRPAVLYFHPWEFDPDQPRMPLSLTGCIRTYTGLKTARSKLDRIMSQPARWTPIAGMLDQLRGQARAAPRLTLGI